MHPGVQSPAGEATLQNLSQHKLDNTFSHLDWLGQMYIWCVWLGVPYIRDREYLNSEKKEVLFAD